METKKLHILRNEHGASISMIFDSVQCEICGKYLKDIPKEDKTYLINGYLGYETCKVKDEQ